MFVFGNRNFFFYPVLHPLKLGVLRGPVVLHDAKEGAKRATAPPAFYDRGDENECECIKSI